MVQIPTSPGVKARPTTVTPTVRRPVDTGEGFIAQGISQLGSVIGNIGMQKLQQKAKEEEVYNVSQVIEFKNQLRRFDSQEKIALSEQAPNQDVINNSSQSIIDRRKNFTESLKGSFQGNDRLLELIGREENNSLVDLEIGIEKDLSGKRKQFGQNQIFEAIGDLKDRFEVTDDPAELAAIQGDLQTTLDLGLSSGLITGKDIENQEKAFAEIRKERQAEALQQAAFAGAARGELILDPTEKNDVDIINQGFEKYFMESDDPLGAAEQISLNTGIIPDQAKSFWTSSLLGGSDKQKIESAQQIVSLQQQNPSLQNQFNDKERALSRAINNRTSIGLTDEQIIQFAETEISDNKSKTQIARQQEFDLEMNKSGKKFNQNLKDIESEIKDRSGILLFDPEVKEVPDEIALDVIRTAKDFYINQGSNVNDAVDEATDTVLSQWGITEIGGKRYQKYSPEAMYPNFPKKALKQQALRQAANFVLDKSVLKEQIRLLPIPNTLNTNKPSYLINLEDNNGLIDVLRDSQNMPVTFTPDITQTDEYKQAIKQKEDLKFTPKRKSELRRRSRDIGKARQKIDPLAIF